MFQFISTLALFENELPDFLRLRLISKKCNQILTAKFFNIPPDHLLYARRTFIAIGTCWACSATGDDVEQSLFSMDDPPRRTIVVCDRWECRLVALISKLHELFHDKFVYFYPSIEDKTYNIPRTNPETKTKGKIAKNYNDIMCFRHEMYYIYVEWKDDNGFGYRKLTPLKAFIKYNNISHDFKVRPIYKMLKDLNVVEFKK